MNSFLQLTARRVAAGAVLVAAACVLVAFTFTETPAESRHRAGSGSPSPIAVTQSAHGQSSYDTMADDNSWQDGGVHYAVDRSSANVSGASSTLAKSKKSAVFKFISSALRPITYSLTIAEPGSLLKSAIKIMHLLGIILGLGAATVLDLVIIKFLVSGKIKSDQITIVKFVTGIVSVGLAILWLSGILYLAHYAAFDPAKLGNQKVWAKIAIVGVLTINGYFIHHTVLPLMDKQVGRSLFAGLSRKQCALMLVFGTVSATSWYVPLVLGAMPHFNFIVPAPRLLVGYAIVLAIAIAATQGMVGAIHRGEVTPKARLQPAA